MPNSTENVRPKVRKPRPKPARPSKATKKTLKGLEKLASNTSRNVMKEVLDKFKSMSMALETQPKPVRPKPVRKPRTAKKGHSFVSANIGNPYGINMVMNNPSKPKPVKKSRKVLSFSVNQVTFPEPSLIQAPAQVPRMMTMDQLTNSGISLNQTQSEARRDIQMFKSAFDARKSAAKKRNSEKKPRSKSKARGKAI